MEYLSSFFNSLIELSNAMAPFILFGLIFAGILHELVPTSIVTKHLGKDNISSVIKATLFGIPLPVCSCGVIPLASSIKKSGASNGSVLSFLISTPITGVDSILATYGVFGWIFTLYRVITSMIIAMIAGIMTNIFTKNENMGKETTTSTCCNSTACCDSSKQEEVTKKFSLIKSLEYSFITLLKDISKPLFWGLIIGALITTLIPKDLGELITQYAWASYLIVILIAVPMYVCATASLPIAAALMLSGVSAGAAFVFLSAGPATNTVTIGVAKKMLGTKSLYIYLGTITFGSIIFGLGLDYIFDISNINPASLINIQEQASLLDMISSIILWFLILYYLIIPIFKKEKSCCTN